MNVSRSSEFVRWLIVIITIIAVLLIILKGRRRRREERIRFVDFCLWILRSLNERIAMVKNLVASDCRRFRLRRRRWISASVFLFVFFSVLASKQRVEDVSSGRSQRCAETSDSFGWFLVLLLLLLFSGGFLIIVVDMKRRRWVRILIRVSLYHRRSRCSL